MTGPRHEPPDEFLEAADRFVSPANELGESAGEIDPLFRADRQEKPQ
jgi:hypothetical protein